MTGAIYAVCYGFALGIALAMYWDLGGAWTVPAYVAGGIGAAAGVAFYRLFGARARSSAAAALVLLAVASGLLGIARYAQRAKVPPFDPARPDAAYHISALLDAFPDTHSFESKTRILGRIVAEPEYAPSGEAGRPGRVTLVVEPILFEPNPEFPEDPNEPIPLLEEGRPGVYRVSGGRLHLVLRPTYFRTNLAEGETDPWHEVYKKLVDPASYGYTIQYAVAVERPQGASNPGAFDAATFYGDQDIYGRSRIYYWPRRGTPPIERIDTASRGGFLTEWALAVKQALLTEIKRTVPFPESAFLAGVTLGARTGLDGVRCPFEGDAPPEGEADTRNLVLEEFRWSGTSHVLAVSGLHVSIIAVALYGLMSGFRIPSKLFAPGIVFCLLLFTLLTGARPSSVRAAIMNSLVLLIYVYGGKSFRASVIFALSVAAAAILWDNPKWLIQPAFTLSVMAIYSLGLLTDPIDRIFSYVPGYTRLPGPLRAFVAAQGAIQLGMMWPLSSYYFTRVSIAGPFANFLAIPLIGVIVPLGLIAAGIGTIPLPYMEYLALLLNAANDLMIRIFLYAAHLSTVLFPFPFVKAFTPAMLAAYFIAVYGFFAFYPRWLPVLRVDWYDVRHGILSANERVKLAARWLVPALAYLALVAYAFRPPTPSGNLRVRFLQAGFGYGNAIHVESPTGRHFVIDAGSATPGGSNVGERVVAQYLLKQQVGSLEAVFSTSPAPEELGGVGAILEIFPTRRFFAPFDPRALPPPSEADAFAAATGDLLGVPKNAVRAGDDFLLSVAHMEHLVRALEAPAGWSGVKRYLARLLIEPASVWAYPSAPEVWRMEAGDVLVEEEGPGGIFRIVALYPPNPPIEAGVATRMAALRIEYGARAVLLPTDLTRWGLESLASLDPKLLASDVVLIPAHGAPSSTSPLFEEALRRARALQDDAPYAILTYSYDRDLKRPRGARGNERLSHYPHRAFYQGNTDETRAKIEAHWRANGYRVRNTAEHGAVLFETDGKTFRVESQLAPLSAGAAEEETAGRDLFREF